MFVQQLLNYGATKGFEGMAGADGGAEGMSQGIMGNQHGWQGSGNNSLSLLDTRLPGAAMLLFCGLQIHAHWVLRWLCMFLGARSKLALPFWRPWGSSLGSPEFQQLSANPRWYSRMLSNKSGRPHFRIQTGVHRIPWMQSTSFHLLLPCQADTWWIRLARLTRSSQWERGWTQVSLLVLIHIL